MRSGKQAQRDAKSLFEACRVNGILDDSRAKEAVHQLLRQKPRGYMGILEAFRQRVRLDVERRTARVESAVSLGPETVAAVEQQLVKSHGGRLALSFETRPELLGGMRIRVGNDIYDGSVAGRLAALEQQW